MKNGKTSRRSTIAGFSIMVVLCVLATASISVLATQSSNRSLQQASPVITPSATAPINSNPTGDEWPMFHDSLNHTGTTTTTPVQSTGLTWSRNMSGMVYSSPTVVGGRLYVGSGDDNVYCLNATTGGRIWNYTTGGNVRESSPAIAGGFAYVGSYDDYLYCFNASTGALNWSYRTGSLITSSPAVSGGRVYVGSDDDFLYCLNATTGALNWSYETGLYVGSSPAIAGGLVYVGSFDHKVYCLNASSGAKVWSCTTGNYVWSSPAVAGGRVCVGSDDDMVHCVNATTGAGLWNYTTTGNVPCSPAFAGGNVYVGSLDGRVYCLNAITGAQVWNYTTGQGVYSSPAIAGGFVYVGSYDDKIYCLNAATGTLVWSYNTGNNVYSSPAIAEGHVYVGSLNDYMYCLPMIFGPSITHESGATCTAGSTGNSISWTIMASIMGTHNPSYLVYRDGTPVTNGSWTNSTPVTLNVDGLSKGNYTYIIEAFDGLGQSVNGTVTVVVTDVPPTITHPSDVSYSHGATGNSISWTVSDTRISTSNYTIYRNGTIIDTGSWTNGTPIIVNVDGLSDGTYNYTIVATDGYGGSVLDTVIVTVVSPSPTISFGGFTFGIVMLLGVAGLVAGTLKKKLPNLEDGS